MEVTIVNPVFLGRAAHEQTLKLEPGADRVSLNLTLELTGLFVACCMRMLVNFGHSLQLFVVHLQKKNLKLTHRYTTLGLYLLRWD